MANVEASQETSPAERSDLLREFLSTDILMSHFPDDERGRQGFRLAAHVALDAVIDEHLASRDSTVTE